MATKKRKASGRSARTDEAKGFGDNKGGKLAVTTFEDVADSEDEFHINRDKILLDEAPDAKRRRKWQDEDALLEPSDEEVLAYSESEDEDDDVNVNVEKSAPRKSAGTASSDEEDAKQEDEESETWGTSRKDYYNNDTIETEADALAEEEEARRMQQKKLQKMSEADFGFDESEWLDARNEEDDGDLVTEVLKDVEITEDMGPKERLRILQTRYPEFEFLANEFVQLQPVLQDLRQEAEVGKSPKISTAVIKCRALAAYMAALTMYFAILTSPAKNCEARARAMDPAELRDHAVMDSLLQCRELWSKVKSLKALTTVEDVSEVGSMADLGEPKPNGDSGQDGAIKATKMSKKERAREAVAAEAAALRIERIKAAEEDFQDLSNLVPKSRISKKSKTVNIADNDSDFGEEESMDAKSAAEKASKKKSLRFYTSRIVQKSNKRAGAGRDAGGDMDVPIRERMRDRQERLTAEAEKRGKKMDEYGRGKTALGGESGSEDDGVAQEVRDEGDEYYDMVAKTQKKKRDDREDKSDAIKKAKAEGAMVRVLEGEMGEDEKRAIGYVIEKNKGLAPKRKKDVRNPRVKKRKKYEEKKKKLASTRAVFKGGEERGGYGGEKTGIKSGLVKSIKL